MDLDEFVFDVQIVDQKEQPGPWLKEVIFGLFSPESSKACSKGCLQELTEGVCSHGFIGLYVRILFLAYFLKGVSILFLSGLL